MINIDLEFFEELIDSLREMIDYADDGIISRGDENYSDFFNAIDRANELYDKATIILENKEVE